MYAVFECIQGSSVCAFYRRATGDCRLQAGETVTRALKRLGAQKAARPRPGKRQPTSGDGAQPQQLSEEEQKAVQAGI